LISDIDVILPTQIEVGRDDEKALTKAIDVVFPNSKQSLCTKHLKDNITDYLKNKIGINTKDRIHLIDLIFREQGTCLYFGKPEVNRADLSCIFSLRAVN
jgi:hypothetical protein